MQYLSGWVYDTLKKDAFGAEFESGTHWCDRLDPKYHHFANCDYRFEPKPHDQHYPYEIRISTQREQRKESYFLNCEKYSKRLLGNAWSIPVIEELLKPLKEICVERVYNGYDYNFPWPPHNLV